MNILKRILGLVWILLGPAAIYFMISNAWQALGRADKAIAGAASTAARAAAEAAKTNTILQWSIIILIFIPVAFGLVIFGRYAVKGEYDL